MKAETAKCLNMQSQIIVRVGSWAYVCAQFHYDKMYDMYDSYQEEKTVHIFFAVF